MCMIPLTFKVERLTDLLVTTKKAKEEENKKVRKKTSHSCFVRGVSHAAAHLGTTQ